MVTNKLLSNSIATALLENVELLNLVQDKTQRRFYVIEGMNLSEVVNFDESFLDEFGVVITIDPIGREDNQSEYDFSTVINVNLNHSGEFFKNNSTVDEVDNHKVYNGVFELEEIVLKIIEIVNATNIQGVDKVKIDYEMPPLQDVSNSSFYTCYISLAFTETQNIGECI